MDVVGGFIRFASLLLEAWRELEAFDNFQSSKKEVWR
jgi:hypothetical protein